MNVHACDHDDPALEINPIFSEYLPSKYREIGNKKHQAPKLGPPSVKPNPVRCSVYPVHTGGLVLGMEGGEVLHWSIEFNRAGRIHVIGNHKGAVTAVQTSYGKDSGRGGLVISGSADGTAKIWTESSGGRRGAWQCLQTLYGHGGSVLAIECFKDYIVTGGTDHKVRVWWAVEERKALEHPWFDLEGVVVTMDGWVQDLCFPPDQKLGHGATLFVADGSAGIVQITPRGKIDPVSKRFGSRLEWISCGSVNQPGSQPLAFRKLHDRGISLIRCVPDVGIVVTASYDNCLRVYNIQSSILQLCWENENGCRFTGIIFDKPNFQVVTTDMHGYLAVYCLKQERLLATKRLTSKPIISIHTRPKYEDFIIVLDSEIQAWRIDRDVGYNIIRGGHTGPVTALYTCSGGQGIVQREQDFRIFSASLDNTVRLWDPYDLGCLRCITETQSEISAMTFCDGENLVIVGHDNGVIRLWNMDTHTFTQLHNHTNSVTALKMASLGNLEEVLLSAGYDGLICIWDIKSVRGSKPHLVAKIKSTNHDSFPVATPKPLGRSEILCLEYHEHRRAIFIGGNDCQIQAWSISSYQYLGKHKGHSEPVCCMAMDANFLFSGSEDRSIRVWDALPATPLGAKLSSVPFDGGTLLKTLEGHKGTVTALAVLKSSGHLVSCSNDGYVISWNYVTGEILQQHKHKEELLCMALRYDADEIITGSRQGNILRFPAGEPVSHKPSVLSPVSNI